MPDPSKGLITTRRRLGEVERIIKPKELDEESGKDFIRYEAKEKGILALAEANNQVVTNLWRRTGGIPLAIKWLVGLVGSGRPLESILQKLNVPEGNPLLDFCFKEAYDSLPPNAKTVF
jgi:hypothetical protein